MSQFACIAAEVDAALSRSHRSSKTFREAAVGLREAAAKNRDQEWQRVNSYIADVLKDAHVLYSKLARLQGDFVGNERDQLESISESVLDIGEKLSHFMKAFHAGEADIVGQTSFGEEVGGSPPGTPPPEIPPEFDEHPAPDLEEEDFEKEIREEEDKDLSEFEEEKEEDLSEFEEEKEEESP